jgi:maleylpyruvate isomerase
MPAGPGTGGGSSVGIRLEVATGQVAATAHPDARDSGAVERPEMPELAGLPDVEVLLGWVEEGQRALEERIAALDDATVVQPSRLPGWSRGHVLAHLARNADALVNLLSWARTGVPTPMYPSSEERNARIEEGAARTPREHRADVSATARRFMEAARALPPSGWVATVRSASGRDLPASAIPWLRAREVWIHLVDLDVGVEAGAIPDAVARALVHEVAQWMSGRVEQGVRLVGPLVDVTLGRSASGSPSRVHGTPQELAAWLVGRSRGERLEVEPPGRLPDLPPWL